MATEYFHYYPNNTEDVFNAYVRAIGQLFSKTCQTQPYHTLMFQLSFSFKYNMNGGTCAVNFIRYQDGTAVKVTYSIYQLVGALCSAHDNDLTLHVQRILGSVATGIQISGTEFTRPENRVVKSVDTPAVTPNVAGSAPVPPNAVPSNTVQPNPARPNAVNQTAGKPAFCPKCGNPFREIALFCSKCGTKRQ